MTNQEPVDYIAYREVTELNNFGSTIIGIVPTNSMIYAVTKKKDLICYPRSVFRGNTPNSERKFPDISSTPIQKFDVLSTNNLFHLLLLTNGQLMISTETPKGLQQFHPAQFDNVPSQIINFVTVSNHQLLVVFSPQYIYIYIYDGETFTTKDYIENPKKKIIDVLGSLTHFLIYDKNSYSIYDIDLQLIREDTLPKNFKAIHPIDKINSFILLTQENSLICLDENCFENTDMTLSEDLNDFSIRLPYFYGISSKHFIMKTTIGQIEESLSIKVKNPVIHILDDYNVIIGGSSLNIIKFSLNKYNPYIPHIVRLRDETKKVQLRDQVKYWDAIIRICTKFDSSAFNIETIIGDLYFAFSDCLLSLRNYAKAFDMFVKSKKHPFVIIHNFRLLLHSSSSEPEFDFLMLANEDCNKCIEVLKETQKYINSALDKKKKNEDYEEDLQQVVRCRTNCIKQSGQAIDLPTLETVRSNLEKLKVWVDESINDATTTSHDISNVLFSLKGAKINSRDEGLYELQLYLNNHVIHYEKQPTALKIYNTLLIECYSIKSPIKLKSFIEENPPIFFDVAFASLKFAAPEEFRRLCCLYGRDQDALQPLLSAEPICWDTVIQYIRSSRNFIELGRTYYNRIYTSVKEKYQEKTVELFFSNIFRDHSIETSKMVSNINECLQIIEEQNPLTIESKNIFESEEQKKNRIEIIANHQIKFLKFVIYRFRTNIQSVHWAFIKLYLRLISLYITQPKSEVTGAYATISQEEEPIKTYRVGLLYILNWSNLYNVQETLDSIMQVSDRLIEERITVLKKAQPPRIREAIDLITHPSFPSNLALKFCDDVYNQNIDKNIYNALLRGYHDMKMNAGPNANNRNLDLNVKNLLNSRADKMQIDDVINDIPKQFSVSDMNDFLMAATVHRINRLRELKLKNALLNVTIKKKMRQVEIVKKGKVIVTSGLACIQCGKKIGQSVFVALPDGTVSHLACRLSSGSEPI